MKIFKAAACIAALIIALYMCIFFKSYYLLSAAAIVIFVIAVDLIFFIPIGEIKTDITSDKTDYVKGEKGNIYVKFKNLRLLPVHKLKAEIKIKNKFYDEEKITVEMPLSVVFAKKITIPFVPDKNGVINIAVEKIKYTDMLGIFSKNKNVNAEYSVIVMPVKGTAVETDAGAADSDEILASNVYLSNNGDVSGYKEYKNGDKKSGINWKMLARTQTLFVRQFERTSADEAVVLLDMYIENLDKAIDILYNISVKGEGFNLLWLPCGNEEFERAYISDDEELKNTLYKIYYSVPDTIRDKALTEYKRLYKGSRVLYISDKTELA